MIRIAVSAESNHEIENAKGLASALKLPFIDDAEKFNTYNYILVYSSQGLTLHSINNNFKPFRIDFVSDALTYRRQHISRKNELLVRALGVIQNYKPTIIDTTAGLGRDAFIMASLGCNVLMLERSDIMCALLRDALKRLKSHPEIYNALSLTLFHTDATTYLSELDQTQLPDIIYIDPMFPARDKSALVKKEMRILKDIVGPDLDSAKLFEVAYEHCLRRVIVKRPKLADPLVERPADIVFRGKATRYDVYLISEDRRRMTDD